MPVSICSGSAHARMKYAYISQVLFCLSSERDKIWSRRPCVFLTASASICLCPYLEDNVSTGSEKISLSQKYGGSSEMLHWQVKSGWQRKIYLQHLCEWIWQQTINTLQAYRSPQNSDGVSLKIKLSAGPSRCVLHMKRCDWPLGGVKDHDHEQTPINCGPVSIFETFFCSTSPHVMWKKSFWWWFTSFSLVIR